MAWLVIFKNWVSMDITRWGRGMKVNKPNYSPTTPTRWSVDHNFYLPLLDIFQLLLTSFDKPKYVRKRPGNSHNFGFIIFFLCNPSNPFAQLHHTSYLAGRPTVHSSATTFFFPNESSTPDQTAPLQHRVLMWRHRILKHGKLSKNSIWMFFLFKRWLVMLKHTNCDN